MTTFNVGYLVGSLSTDSINRKLAPALTRLAPEGMTFHEIGFADLPLYTTTSTPTTPRKRRPSRRL